MEWGGATASNRGNNESLWLHRDSRGVYQLILLNTILITPQDSLLPTVQEQGYEGKQWIFQQDNDPKHTALVTRQWLRDHNIYTLKWPSKSPDISPIENAWAELECCMERHNPLPKTINQLWALMQEIWNSEDFNDYVRHLFVAFPHRIQGLLEKKGHWLKY